MSCLFCDIDQHHDQKILFENNLVIYTQNEKYQGALKHSGVIVPVAHRETVFDLTQEEVIATFEILKEVKSYLDLEHKPDGYNVGWNNGAVGGQHIFHAHMHVIPRFKQEPMAYKGIRAHLGSEANKW